MNNLSYGSKTRYRSRIMSRYDDYNPMIQPLDKLVEQIESPLVQYYLEQISSFLKNSKKQLCFPKTPPDLEAFLVRVIKDVYNFERLLKVFDCNSKEYALEIIDSMKKNKNVFSLTYTYGGSIFENSVLVFKKIFNNKYYTPGTVCYDIAVGLLTLGKVSGTNESGPSTSKASNEQLIRNQKAIEIKKRVLEGVEKSFINAALRTIVDFINSDMDGVLVFTNADEDQMKFILNACAIPKSPNWYSMFANDSMVLMRMLDDSLTCTKNFTIEIDVSKRQKDDELRTVTLKKELKVSADKKNRQESRTPEKDDDGKTATKSDSAKVKQNAMQTLSELPHTSVGDLNNPTGNYSNSRGLSKKKGDNYERSSKNTPDCLKESTNNKGGVMKKKGDDFESKTQIPESLKKSTNASVSKKGDDFESKTQQIPESLKKSTVTEGVNKKGDDFERKSQQAESSESNAEKKSKLIPLEAMTDPTESEIPTKKTNKQEDPPAVRGDCITEPLSLDPREGLGHTADKRQVRHKSGFRMDLFEQVKYLLGEENTKLIIEYTYPLTQNEEMSVIHTIDTLNKRYNIPSKDKCIRDLIDSVLEQLKGEPTIKVDYDVSEDKRFLTLRKSINIVKDDQLAIQQGDSSDNVEIINKMCISMPKPITKDYILSVGSLYLPGAASLKTIKTFGLKVVILHTILEFLQSEDTKTVLCLEYPMKIKEIKLLKSIITQINEGQKPSSTSDIETAIIKGILNHIGETRIQIFVEAKKKINMERINESNTIKSIVKGDYSNNNNNTIKKVTTQLNITDTNITKPTVSYMTSTDLEEVNTTNKVVTNEDKVVADDQNDDSNEYLKNDDIVSINPSLESEEMYSAINEIGKAIMEANDENIEVETDSIKSTRSDSENSANIRKDTKDIAVYLHIVPSEDEKSTMTSIRLFQNALSENIINNTSLPLIECHGVENGVLVYSCHNKEAVDILTSVARDTHLDFITSHEEFKEKTTHKVRMRLNSYIGVNLRRLFQKIECYNLGLSTDRWSVINVQTLNEYVIVEVEIDDLSFEYIAQSKFKLFAGVDKLYFSIAWWD